MNPPTSHIDELYAAFTVARDSFIATHRHKYRLRDTLYPSRFYFRHFREDQQRFDDALAKYALEWWKTFGHTISLNREDGSFTVCENADFRQPEAKD